MSCRYTLSPFTDKTNMRAIKTITSSKTEGGEKGLREREGEREREEKELERHHPQL